MGVCQDVIVARVIFRTMTVDYYVCATCELKLFVCGGLHEGGGATGTIRIASRRASSQVVPTVRPTQDFSPIVRRCTSALPGRGPRGMSCQVACLVACPLNGEVRICVGESDCACVGQFLSIISPSASVSNFVDEVVSRRLGGRRGRVSTLCARYVGGPLWL